MKETLIQIADILYEIPKMSRQRMQGIMNPLRTERQAVEMLNYLKQNQNNKEKMGIDKLMMKSLQIAEKN